LAAVSPTDRADDISVQAVSKTYGRLHALGELSFQVKARTIVGIVGPSGCGKSTLLHIVAGLLEPTDGAVLIGGVIPSSIRGSGSIGLIFQDEALLPWRTVAGNIRLPLDLSPAARRRGTGEVEKLLSLIGLSSFQQAYPRELSGGMRQRVSIARALVTQPSTLLLDEPFASLDEPLRRRLMIELERIWLDQATTALMVSHSIAEAVFLSDAIIVLSARPGRVIAHIEIDVARPRGYSFLKSPIFHQLCDQVMELFPVGD
jgi:NitT/TauT family transport system ATP-binding protein